MKRVLDVISLFLQPCEMMIMNSGVPVLAVQRHWHCNSLPKVHCPLHYNSRGFTSCVTVYSCPHYTTNERTSISAPFFFVHSQLLHSFLKASAVSINYNYFQLSISSYLNERENLDSWIEEYKTYCSLSKHNFKLLYIHLLQL
jgi:hypothetical protein